MQITIRLTLAALLTVLLVGSQRLASLAQEESQPADTLSKATRVSCSSFRSPQKGQPRRRWRSIASIRGNHNGLIQITGSKLKVLEFFTQL